MEFVRHPSLLSKSAASSKPCRHGSMVSAGSFGSQRLSYSIYSILLCYVAQHRDDLVLGAVRSIVPAPNARYSAGSDASPKVEHGLARWLIIVPRTPIQPIKTPTRRQNSPNRTYLTPRIHTSVATPPPLLDHISSLQ